MLLPTIIMLLNSVAGLPGARGQQGRTLLAAAPTLPLDTIRLPPGFRIELYVNATVPTRFMALGQADQNAGTSIVYVSSTDAGVVSTATAGAVSRSLLRVVLFPFHCQAAAALLHFLLHLATPHFPLSASMLVPPAGDGTGGPRTRRRGGGLHPSLRAGHPQWRCI